MKDKHARQNLELLLAANDPALMDIIAEYQNGVDVSEALAEWSGGGTTGAIIAELLKTLDEKPKKKRTTKNKKDTPPSLEN